MASEKVLLDLLDQRYRLLLSTNDVGVTWWTTTMILSVSIIGLLWKERDNIRSLPYLKSLFHAISAFYATTIFFGCWLIWSIHQLENEVSLIMGQLTVKKNMMKSFVFFGSEIGHCVGVIDFVLVAWFWWRFTQTFKEDSNQSNQ